MGGGDSKEVDSTGEVNNNVIVQETKGNVNDRSSEVVILMYIICGLKLLELGLYLYKFHQKKMKKKYIKAASTLNLRTNP